MIPNFLFIGPDKSGSSWLHAVLQNHSQAWVPEFKDIYFFDRYYDRGMQWYTNLFSACPSDARAVGEFSHDYLFSPVAAQRIATHLEGVRLLTILRDPVERTFSQYLYLLRSGRTQLRFEDALAAFPVLTNNSMYYQHLRTYFELFERKQLGVFWFRELEKDPQHFAQRIFEFLDIDFEPELNFDSRVRPASRPRFAFLARLAKKSANLARELGMPALVGAIKHGRMTRLLYKPYDKSDRPVIGDDTAARLREQFQPDVERLQALLGADLGSWL